MVATPARINVSPRAHRVFMNFSPCLLGTTLISAPCEHSSLCISLPPHHLVLCKKSRFRRERRASPWARLDGGLPSLYTPKPQQSLPNCDIGRLRRKGGAEFLNDLGSRPAGGFQISRRQRNGSNLGVSSTPKSLADGGQIRGIRSRIPRAAPHRNLNSFR